MPSGAPRSQTGGNMLRAFLYGGAICCVGQAFLNLYTALGLDSETGGDFRAVERSAAREGHNENAATPYGVSGIWT